MKQKHWVVSVISLKKKRMHSLTAKWVLHQCALQATKTQITRFFYFRYVRSSFFGLNRRFFLEWMGTRFFWVRPRHHSRFFCTFTATFWMRSWRNAWHHRFESLEWVKVLKKWQILYNEAYSNWVVRNLKLMKIKCNKTTRYVVSLILLLNGTKLSISK